MKEHPLVSVIVPTSDRPNRLSDCLESIRGQTLRDCEILVVVNGASADDEAQYEAIAKRWMGEIEFLWLQQSGLVAAIRAGLLRTGGRYVWIMDDDDLASARWLETMVAHMEGCSCAAAYSDRIESGGQFWGPVPAAITQSRLARECNVAWPQLLLRRAALEALDLPDELLCSDWDLQIKLHRYGLCHVPGERIVHRWHASNYSQNGLWSEHGAARIAARVRTGYYEEWARHHAWPRVFVFCPDLSAPTGGIKVLYRQVEALNDLGIDAWIVHGRRSSRPNWFDSRAPIAWRWQIKLQPQDVAVIPEVWWPRTARLAGPARKVVVVQNPYLLFSGMRGSACEDYRRRDLVLLATSADTERYLAHAFPVARTHRFQWAIDERLFYPGAKKKQIAWMPRKGQRDAEQVFGILGLRGCLRGWRLAAIDGMHETDVARILRESLFFFSFGAAEGLPLPPAEAMAAGCVVVGYNGRGGAEYFDSRWSWPIEAGNILEFTRTAEELLALAAGEGRWGLEALGLYASQMVTRRYSRRALVKNLAGIWGELLERDLAGAVLWPEQEEEEAEDEIEPEFDQLVRVI